MTDSWRDRLARRGWIDGEKWAPKIEAEFRVLEKTTRLYEELRAEIDGGSESMTHEDALQAVRDWRNTTA